MSELPNTQELLELIGDPPQVAREMEDYSRSTRFLSSSHQELLRRFPNQWVAVYRGRARASGDSLETVLERVDALGLPRANTLVRYMNPNPIPMIL
jgi:hypothetical protein